MLLLSVPVRKTNSSCMTLGRWVLIHNFDLPFNNQLFHVRMKYEFRSRDSVGGMQVDAHNSSFA